MRKCAIIFLSLVCFLSLPSLLVVAQETTGTLKGKVADETGAVLPGASVIVNSPALVTKDLTVVTNEAGWYIIRALPPGVYSIRASLEGFQTIERSGIIVEQAKEFRVDFTLKIGTLEETITVSGEAPLIDSTRPSISQTIDTNYLENLPATTTGRRQYSEIIRVLPGVTDDSQDGMYGSPMIYGTRKFDVGYRVEGVQTNDLSYGWFAGFVPMDALEDIQVKGTAISAEYGWNQGGIVSMRLKQGGNEFHGIISDYYSNNSFWGDPDFKRTDNQLSFTLGGPVKKDKIWFFGAYQRYHRDEEIWGRTDNLKTTRRAPMIIAKVTAQVTPKNRLSANVYSSHTNRANVGMSGPDYPPETYGKTGYWTDSVSGDLVTTLSDKFFLESHFDYRLFERFASYEGNNTYIETMSDLFSVLPNGWRAQGQPNGDHDWYDQYEAKMKLSAFLEGKGVHNMAMGWDLFRWNAKLEVDTRSAFTIYDDPSIAGGIAVLSTTNIPNQNPYYNDVTSFAIFFNDDWTITDNFTANLGFRFGSDIFYRTNNHFEPRFGINFDPLKDGLSRIKVSYSRFYGAIYLRYISVDQQSATRSQIFLFDPNSPTYTGAIWSTYLQPASAAFNNPDLKTPYTDEVAISYERKITEDISASVAYIKRWQKDQFIFADANIDADTGAYIGDTPLPNIENLGKGDYDCLQLVLKKRFSHRYQWQFSYNWSRSKNTADNAYLSWGYLPFPPNQLSARYGISDDDKPHFVRGVFSVLLPLDIQVAGFYSYRSGRPYSNFNLAYNRNFTPYTEEFIGERNEYRLPGFHDLSLHLEKDIPIQKLSLGIIGEILNVFNDKTVTSVYTYGSRFGQARNSRYGRGYQIAFRLKF
jgi:outer membrane receptor for ferrienterochelin and colicin